MLSGHCGSNPVSLEEVRSIPCPELERSPTGRLFVPIGHGEFVDNIRDAIDRAGLEIQAESYSLNRENAQLFGVFALASDPANPAYSLAIGFRNSHDRSMAAGLVLGENVFVCDNLMFNGEYKVFRKHTRNIRRELPGIISHAVWNAFDGRRDLNLLNGRMRDTEITDLQAHDAICRGVRAGAIPSSKAGAVLNDWHCPRHAEFAARTVWSLKNCFTETWKAGKRPTLHQVEERSVALRPILESFLN